MYTFTDLATHLQILIDLQTLIRIWRLFITWILNTRFQIPVHIHESQYALRDSFYTVTNLVTALPNNSFAQ